MRMRSWFNSIHLNSTRFVWQNSIRFATKTNNFQVNLVSFADVRMCKCNVRVATVPDLFWQPVNEFYAIGHGGFIAQELLVVSLVIATAISRYRTGVCGRTVGWIIKRYRNLV